MSRRNPHAQQNRGFLEPALEGFTGQYDIELKVFNDGLHWRLEDPSITLDVWPTSRKFYIKDMCLGRPEFTKDRTGILPSEYTKLDYFLKGLFGKTDGG